MPSDNHANRWLAIYLNDHRAGATAGVALASRVARGFRGREFGEPLARISREIEEDRAALIALMSELGVRRSLLKPFVAALGERMSRAKPNGAFLQRSPLDDLVELETLALGILGKVGMWRVLRSASREGSLANRFDRLLSRAEAQHSEIEAMRIRVANRVLR